jgi:cobalt-zinc-cadmium efflux system membrane fusion protein
MLNLSSFSFSTRTPAQDSISKKAWLGVLFGLFVPLALAACQKGNAAPSASTTAADLAPSEHKPEANDPQVSTIEAHQLESVVVEPVKAAQSITKNLSGRLVWNETCTVRVFSSVAGRVHKICADAGQLVKEGDTLATMFSVDFGQAQADASKAAADLKFAERTYSRAKDLFEHGAAARKDVEAAEDDLETKKAERARAFARLSLYGVGVGAVDGLFPLKAPLSGVLVEKNLNPGQEVRPDQMLANDARLVQPLFVISDPTRLSILLDVTDLDIETLRPGQEIKVHTRAFPDRIFVGKLEHIGDSLDPLTRTVKVRGSLDNPEGLLKAEMYVSADVVTGDGTTPLYVASKGEAGPVSVAGPVEISSKAIFIKQNQYFVFVEKMPGNYVRQLVEIVAEKAGRVLVASGLSVGERVVIEGNLLLQSKAEESK